MQPELTVYRICKTKYVSTAFDGEGAWRFGGRWNSSGTRMIYTAGSLALAALEMLVHLQDDSLLSKYSFITAHFSPNLVLRISEYRALPANWSSSPAPKEIQQIGDDWVRESVSAVLEVPTSVIPIENNFLVNPAHPAFRKFRFGIVQEFTFDPRLNKTDLSKTD